MVACFVSVLVLGLLIEGINAIPCGGYIQTLPGSVQSPNYPDRYPPNTECTWIIEAADDHNVQLNFITFDIVLDSLCSGDKVDFKDGPDENSPWIASYCGNISPPNITTTGRYLYIRFVSDDQIQTTGMHLRYDQVPACKIRVNNTSGFISSPNYPDNYPSLIKCVWIIYSPYESVVQLTILNHEIEYEANCLYDSLNIYDGRNESSFLLGKFCGSFVNKVLNSTSNILFLQFKSDTSDELSGFHAAYEVFVRNISQMIGSLQMNKLDDTRQTDSIQAAETTLIGSNGLTSVLSVESSDNELPCTIYDPSIKDSTTAVSASLFSEQEYETLYSLSSSSSTSSSIMEHVIITTFTDSDKFSIESSDKELPFTNNDPSIKYSIIAVSTSMFSEPVYETLYPLSPSSASSTLASIMEHVEISDSWTIEIISSSHDYTSNENSGFMILMSVMQRKYQSVIAASRVEQENGESSNFGNSVPMTQSNMESYEIHLNTKIEQIQPTVLDYTYFIMSRDEMSTELVTHTLVDNKTRVGTTIFLPMIISLITCGIVIGVVCAIKYHIKKITALKIAPVEDAL